MPGRSLRHRPQRRGNNTASDVLPQYFLCPRCRAGGCYVALSTLKGADEIWVSMPSMSGGGLLRLALLVRRLMTRCFYALDVGRGLLRVHISEAETRRKGFYALDVGRGVVTVHRVRGTASASFLCPRCRAEGCYGCLRTTLVTWAYAGRCAILAAVGRVGKPFGANVPGSASGPAAMWCADRDR
jgi:hypothetical protein